MKVRNFKQARIYPVNYQRAKALAKRSPKWSKASVTAKINEALDFGLKKLEDENPY